MPLTGTVKTGEDTTGYGPAIVYAGDDCGPTGESKTGECTTGGTAGYAEFVVDGRELRTYSATLTPTTLRLEVRARTDRERLTLERLDANAGAYDQRDRADGTIQGVDTAAGSNTFTVTPPLDLEPERITRDWLVDSVSRRRTSADTKATRATVEFIATDTRAPASTLTETTAANSWEFTFADGRIVTDRVHDIDQGETTTVTLALSPVQAELFETDTPAAAGAVIRGVPDGETFTEDTTPNSRQTVTVDPPDNASSPAITVGDYVVSGWESQGADAGAYRVSMELSSRYEPS